MRPSDESDLNGMASTLNSARKLSLSEWLAESRGPTGEEMVIYKARYSSPQPGIATSLAKRFKLEGKCIEQNRICFTSQNQKMLALYDNQTAFWYMDFSKLYQSDYRPELPTEQEAVKIATEFLKQNRWQPEGLILEGAHPGYYEQVEGEKRQRQPERANHICVDYWYCINGLKSYGAGAKLKVFVGDRGEILGVYNFFSQLEEYARASLFSASELEEILSHKLGLPLERIEVQNAKLVYKVDSPLIHNRFVQPAYVFTLATTTRGTRSKEPTPVNFMTHPLPATRFAPVVLLDVPANRLEIKQGETLTLKSKLLGGTAPFKICWESNVDGFLGEEPVLKTSTLSLAHRERRLTSHTIRVTVTDSLGLTDTHQMLVKVQPANPVQVSNSPSLHSADMADPFVGVEWCNNYNGTPGLPDISGTSDSAQGFKTSLQSLPGWSARFDWGNDFAWEEDFKVSTASGGGTDIYWADNVDFAFFAGHGSPGAFYFGSARDDHQQLASDSRWGDGRLKWIVLHACETMRANFGWTVWCDTFKGLHQMFGFHTVTEGSSPPLGSRFGFWLAFKLPWSAEALFNMQQAWRLACSDCFDSSVEYAVISANQSGTDTYNDHLPGYGYVSPDPASPNCWSYSRGTC
ncbi:MAG TPA: DUF6345 domain-containing protein [Chloroflexia bacterium]|nr:DUF6345 domain-containing protein [Chloroflexia bacterium]